jgi:glycosyltransferase involved in cell wall biosynthesis
MTATLSSLVVPIYRNAESIAALVEAIRHISAETQGDFEVLFVIDGSPDDSRDRLVAALRDSGVYARVIDHSRNFGSFAAIRTGMSLARGSCIAVMSADLQEPPELVIEFLRRLQEGGVDVLAGQRASREDPGDGAARVYWRLYRRFVLPDIPASGVDVFACTAAVRDVICSLESSHTSLVAQLFWVGFRRDLVSYDRRPSQTGSGWTFSGKLRYLTDSVFAFTDLPVRILWFFGAAGLAIATMVGVVVLAARIVGLITVPGYAATILVLLFFASLNLLGLGIIGSYVYRAYETSKQRPGAVIRDISELPPTNDNA